MFRNRRRYGRSRISSFILTFVIVLAIGMGIGYAAIATTLTIDGTSDIDSARWDVHFENINVTTGSVTANTPTITDDTSVSFSATLENPGDYYEFTVDVVNEGTLDAKINAITILPVLTTEQEKYFNYNVTYNDGQRISVNDGLNKASSKTILIKVEYLVQSDTSLYPTEDVSFNFSVSINYVQGTGNPVLTSATFKDINFDGGNKQPISFRLCDAMILRSKFLKWNGESLSEDDILQKSYVRLDDETTPYKIYAFVDPSVSSTTTYWWSDADVVYLPANSDYLFQAGDDMNGCNFQEIYLDGINASHVTSMNYMFYSEEYTYNDPTASTYKVHFGEGFDSSNVTSMVGTFSGAEELGSSLSDVDFEHLDVSSVTTMEELFKENYYIGSADLSAWNTSNVTNVNNMFSGTFLKTDCSSCVFDLSSFDFPNISNNSISLRIRNSNNPKFYVKNQANQTWFLSNVNGSNTSNTLIKP